MLKKLFSQVLYVKVYKDSFEILDSNTGEVTTLISVKGFSSSRMAVADFEEADKTLSRYPRVSRWRQFFTPRPAVVMHQKYMHEDMAPVERRILVELAFGYLEARNVFLWQGLDLTLEDIKQGRYKDVEKF